MSRDFPQSNKELFSIALAGVDAKLDPDLLVAENLAYGRNISIRGGRVQQRPKIVKRMMLPPGLFQGMHYHDFGGRQVILMSICGQIFEVDPLGRTIKSILSSVDPTALLYGHNGSRLPRAYFVSTPSGVVIQDGESYALTYNGLVAARSGGDTGIPLGTVMEYSNGRLAVAQQRSLRLGDIYQGAGTEWKFIEEDQLDGGGSFTFPSKVTSIKSLPIQDSASGQGPRIIGTLNSTHSLHTEVTKRSSWADTDNFQTDLFPTVGVVGRNACVQVNQDLYFRSSDGLRSIKLTAVNSSSPANTPISDALDYRLGNDHPLLLADVSTIFFDNRILTTAAPIVWGTRPVYTSLVVLNVEAVQKSGQVQQAFEGEWDGYRVLQLLTGTFSRRSKGYFVGLDEDGNTALYEILKENDQENWHQEEVLVKEIETRAFLGNDASALKRLLGADVHLSNVRGAGVMNLYFRADGYTGWRHWGTKAFNAGDNPQDRIDFKSLSPVEDIDIKNGLPKNFGYRFQLRLVWTGDAKIERIFVHTAPVSESVYEQSYQEPVADELENLRRYWYSVQTLLYPECMNGVDFFNPSEDPLPPLDPVTGDPVTPGETEIPIKQGLPGTCFRTVRKKNIVLRVNPEATWTTYTLVENVPSGLVPNSITGGGVWNSTTRTITWTITSSPTSIATFMYNVDGPDGEYNFTGTLSYTKP